MRRSGYLAILAIVTILAIIVGIAIHVFGLIKDTAEGYGLSFPWNSGYGKKVEFNEDTDDFKNIKIEVDYADITIQDGDGYTIAYVGGDKLQPEYNVNGDTLEVKSQKGSKVNIVPISGTTQASITITVPKGSKLDNVSVESDAANVSILNITIDELDAEGDAGNFYGTDCTFGDASIKLDAGNIDLDQCEADSLKMKAEAGNIKFKDGSFTNLKADTEAGNIDIRSNQDLSKAEIKAKTGLGDVEIQNHDVDRVFTQSGSGITVELETELGDIELNW